MLPAGDLNTIGLADDGERALARLGRDIGPALAGVCTGTWALLIGCGHTQYREKTRGVLVMRQNTVIELPLPDAPTGGRNTGRPGRLAAGGPRPRVSFPPSGGVTRPAAKKPRPPPHEHGRRAAVCCSREQRKYRNEWAATSE
ncbi:hypothetical protein [Streptomyces abikoensis]|uniref:hypothetical protein n=1 Tax=Streptomyces abikoensis TaxID=97398 RepID=UPI0036B2D3D0